MTQAVGKTSSTESLHDIIYSIYNILLICIGRRFADVHINDVFYGGGVDF